MNEIPVCDDKLVFRKKGSIDPRLFRRSIQKIGRKKGDLGFFRNFGFFSFFSLRTRGKENSKAMNLSKISLSFKFSN